MSSSIYRAVNTTLIYIECGGEYLMLHRTKKENDCKKHKTSPQNSSAAGFAYVLKQPKIPYFKRFLGIEKVHRSSIKITVDLWRSGRDSNPRTAFDRHTISSRARYDRFDTTP